MEATTNPTTWIADALRRNELVAVIGTGLSMGLTDGKIPALSWKGLIHYGFAFGAKKGRISPGQVEAWRPQLESSDLDDLLGAAEFMSRKLDAPQGDLYARLLEHVFSTVKPTNKEFERAVLALKTAGVLLCTLNYDQLLEHVTGLPTVTLNDTRSVTAWMRREHAGILHLHGSWHLPVTCVLGIRDYEATLQNEVRALFQRHLGFFRRLLFLGCGDTFADPNLSALIRWLRENLKTAAPEHYALVTSGEMATRHSDPAWHGFVEPLSYGASHDELPAFLLRHLPAPTPTKKRRSLPPKSPWISDHEKVLKAYREYLIKDCGQMTIEGVRADMDTAQRRFDLERLFVPLHVVPTPPEILQTDPEREQKLLQWREECKKPRPFGSVFTDFQRLALLALPGGGKTLLLKRLAVAYANPIRREASGDGLPSRDLVPVLIRCREWREHIHRPVAILLNKLPEITGQTSLIGLSEALLPLFTEGRVLLLIDGLDEIHDDATRATFVENIEKFLERYPLTRLVVTSREAGFGLVAPNIARFCERWRVAPLGDEGIVELCEHWHRLMTGDSEHAQQDAQELALHLTKNDSLRRLAENPLLLTMLLVVKHGAGRLPPDRVSLYGRAVEVLLDTWNIKGHAPLNTKEAVPQLACVAFQLMRAGKQTATEKELLSLLDEARDKVPQIRRYAKGTSDAFLKRVELRSSLLVEAGHQIENGRPVPFYQFRHLTFQEYLTAVACAEGHYFEYEVSDTVLTPLSPFLIAEEWKEVVPMSAVLARKQAEPLLAALVAQGTSLRLMMEADEDFAGRKDWLTYPTKLPPAISRLTQCLVEEAEATPETLTAALQVIAAFAAGCNSNEDWRTLACGPFGEDLFHQAWMLYQKMEWPDMRVIQTCARIAGLRHPEASFAAFEVQREVRVFLDSESIEHIARGLFICAGWRLTGPFGVDVPTTSDRQWRLRAIEKHLFHDNPAIWATAAWAYGLEHFHRRGDSSFSSPALNRLLKLWLGDAVEQARRWAAMALYSQLGIPRGAWKPTLTREQRERFHKISAHVLQDNFNALPAACMIAFHTRTLWSDDKLAHNLVAVSRSPLFGSINSDKNPIRSMLRQLGEIGEKHLELESRRSREGGAMARADVPPSRPRRQLAVKR